MLLVWMLLLLVACSTPMEDEDPVCLDNERLVEGECVSDDEDPNDDNPTEDDLDPIVELIGDYRIVLPLGEAYTELGVSIQHADMADVTIEIQHDIDVNQEGKYPVIYVVTIGEETYRLYRYVEVESALRTELRHTVTLLREKVQDLVPSYHDASLHASTELTFLSHQSQLIVLPDGNGYTIPDTETTMDHTTKLHRDGIWGRIDGNVSTLLASGGWVDRIIDMIWSDTPLDNITLTDGVYSVYDEGFEARVSLHDDVLDLTFFHAEASTQCDGGYDRTFARYNEETGFLILTAECYFNGMEEVEQIIATYMNQALNEATDRTYTLFTYESNPVGEDLLLTISSEDHSVTGIMDRYLNQGDIPPFRLGHIVIMKEDGYNIGQIVNPNYYDRTIANWNVILALPAFEGWSHVYFDGTNPGVIYNDTQEIEGYGVRLLGDVPYITQDLSSLQQTEFTAEAIDTLFAYPNGLTLANEEEIKELFLLATTTIDPTLIGLSEMSREGLYQFMMEIQSEFETMRAYHLAIE
jgi:hypothetical protein